MLTFAYAELPLSYSILSGYSFLNHIDESSISFFYINNVFDHPQVTRVNCVPAIKL